VFLRRSFGLRACARCGKRLISFAVSLAVPAGVVFVPHKTPAFARTAWIPISPHRQIYRPADKMSRLYKRSIIVLFFIGASALTFYPPCAFGA